MARPFAVFELCVAEIKDLRGACRENDPINGDCPVCNIQTIVNVLETSKYALHETYCFPFTQTAS